MVLLQLSIITILVIIGIATVIVPIVKKIHYGIIKSNDKKEFENLSANYEIADLQDEEALEKYETIYKAMQRYNEDIYNNGQSALSGELPENEVLFDTSECLDIETFGYIYINGKRESKFLKKQKDKKELIYPIYLKSNKANLLNGFATMPFTSLPIGGKNTLSVLYGYAKKSIIKSSKCVVNIGDEIILKNPYDELKYVVSDMGFIGSNETEYLKIMDGQTEIALLMFLPQKEKRLCIYAKKKTKHKSTYDEYDN